MTTQLITGPYSWSMTRDTEGHREYKLVHRVKGAYTDGPARVIQTPGLPIPGSWWIVYNDIDLWAWCRANATVTPEIDGEKNYYWKVEQTFSTKPPDQNKQRCQDNSIQDPLLEPQKVSGSFVKYQEEATYNRFGVPILSSSHELIRGSQVEFDRNRLQVKIEQNVAILNLSLVSSMMDTLNNAPLWGLPRRCVKLSNFSWEPKLYGTCFTYYTRRFEFDINYETFDRTVLDEGTKVLSGHWDENGAWVLDQIGGQDPNPNNPAHFIRMKDRRGENMRAPLDGYGKPIAATMSGAILSATFTDPIEIVCAFDHNMATGTQVAISGVRGNTNANGTFTITVTGATSFLLNGSTSNGAHVANTGTWVRLTGGPGQRRIEKYGESNFLLLGIPITF